MTGRAAVTREQQRLDAVFTRVDSLPSETELRSDFARYLCVLVSGFLETAVAELLLEHSRRCAAPTIQRFVDSKTSGFTNANSEKLLQLLGSFDPEWRAAAEKLLQDEFKTAVDSVVSLRHGIAHGRNTGITYIRVKDYYDAVKEVVRGIADICVPEP